MKDFSMDNCAFGNFISDKNGDIQLLPGGEKPNEKLFLSESAEL